MMGVTGNRRSMVACQNKPYIERPDPPHADTAMKKKKEKIYEAVVYGENSNDMSFFKQDLQRLRCIQRESLLSLF